MVGSDRKTRCIDPEHGPPLLCDAVQAPLLGANVSPALPVLSNPPGHCVLVLRGLSVGVSQQPRLLNLPGRSDVLRLGRRHDHRRPHEPILAMEYESPDRKPRGQDGSKMYPTTSRVPTYPCHAWRLLGPHRAILVRLDDVPECSLDRAYHRIQLLWSRVWAFLSAPFTWSTRC